MRAVVVRPGTPGLEIVDVPAPALPAGGIRVRMLEAGVCGTDHDIVEGRYGKAPAGSPYLILGHENLGEVLEADASAPGFRSGDLVVATVRRGCGRCRFCLSNRSDCCETGAYTERGISGAHGYFADEYVELPEYVVPVPAPLRPFAVLLEPLSVVEKAVEMGHRVLDRKEPTPGHPPTAAPKALVAGTGAIGMLGAFVLRARGYDVVGVDRHDGTPSEVALHRIGARHTNVAGGLEALGSERFDLVLEASGSAPLDFRLVDRLAPNGVLVLTGIPDPTAGPTAVPAGALFHGIVLENQAIVGSVNANRSYFETGLRDLGTFETRWPGAVAGLISVRRPIGDAREVLLERPGGTIKTVLTIVPGGAPATSAR